jgi:hypothetical protein
VAFLLCFGPRPEYGLAEDIRDQNGRATEIPDWCTPLWQAWQSVIRFCSVSSPDRLRKAWWWTSRFDIVPQNWKSIDRRLILPSICLIRI